MEKKERTIKIYPYGCSTDSKAKYREEDQQKIFYLIRRRRRKKNCQALRVAQSVERPKLSNTISKCS